MEPLGSVSVQAMRGRFEMLRDPSPPAATPSKEKIPPRKISTPYKLPVNPNPKLEREELLANDEGPDSQIDPIVEREEDERTDSRTRSMSVGNCRLPGDKFLKSEQTPSRIFRNQSFNHSRFGRGRNPCQEEGFTEEDLATFSEKQRLVESIVMNIKNSAKNDSNLKPKQRQTMTSKLEKDLKNALEKGVRKWNIARHKDKLPKEQLPYISSPIINDEDYNAFREETSVGGPKIYNEYQGSEREEVTGSKSESKNDQVESKYLRTRNRDLYFNSKVKSRQNAFASAEMEDVTNEDLDEYKENFLYQVLSYNNNSASKRSFNERPVRPPRRRNAKKKSRAPMPPCKQSEPIQQRRLSPNQLATEGKDDGIYYSTPCDDSAFQSPDTSFCEEDRPSYDEPDSGTIRSPEVVSSPLPGGLPPKKPPRTFAHDIYKCLKPNQNERENEAQFPLVKSIPKDIEALYTKPIKRVAIKEPVKEVDQAGNKEGDSNRYSKPNIAPKPPIIADRAKKRYSVADPVSSPREDMLDRGTAIKRNSSFRFSLRKMKKFSSPKRDGQVGKRWKQISRNLNLQKEEINIEEKTIRQLSKSEEILSSGGAPDDPIYATPLNPSARRRGASQELHYMCSPLFDMETDKKHQNHQMRTPSRVQLVSNDASKINRQGIIDGLKREFRQSCRILQKRFNK